MTKVGKIALLATSLALASASTPAFAFSERALSAGAREAKHLMRLMDKDQNGQVSKAEFMQFMEAEFDRLDRDRSGQLSAEELSRSPIRYAHKTTVPHR
jgi:Ca2+-binding EF-hand superfamily protein